MVEEPINEVVIVGKLEGTNFNQNKNIYDGEGIAPTIFRQGHCGNEPKILCPKRTEYGKMIRKKYEKKEINESRHNMTMMQTREDGVSNTLTTVQKDNLLLEPTIIQKQGDRGTDKYSISDTSYTIPVLVEPILNVIGTIDLSFDQTSRVYDIDGISPTIMSNSHGKSDGGYIAPKIMEPTQNNKPILVGGVGDINFGKGIDKVIEYMIVMQLQWHYYLNQ